MTLDTNSVQTEENPKGWAAVRSSKWVQLLLVLGFAGCCGNCLFLHWCMGGHLKHDPLVWDRLADVAIGVLAVSLLGMQAFTRRPHRRSVLVLLMALCVLPIAVLASSSHTHIFHWVGMKAFGGLVLGSLVGFIGSVVAMLAVTVRRHRP